jgi:hypothetical protein
LLWRFIVMANLYLPQKAAQEINHTLTTPGTYSWTAPNALNNGSSYQITLQMWGAGSGGASGNQISTFGGGGGGAGGAYLFSKVTVVPGTVYTFVVGTGGSGGAGSSGINEPNLNAGGAGGSTSMSDSGLIISAGGGSSQVITIPSGWYSTSRIQSGTAVGGAMTVSQPTKVSGQLSLSGGNGGFGGANAQSVSNAFGQPGGISGGVGTNFYSAGTGGSAVGSGGGASSQKNGANGGGIVAGGDYGGSAGGGGGGGYTAAGIGANNIAAGSSSGAYRYGHAGGTGGNGRLTFLFITSNGGSAGVAPA